jgi:hypothetical protein
MESRGGMILAMEAVRHPYLIPLRFEKIKLTNVIVPGALLSSCKVIQG